MAHVDVPEGMPGIRGLMMAYPQFAVHMNGIANALLRGDDVLTAAERETIAVVASRTNECIYCSRTHAAVARCHWGDEAGAGGIMDQILEDYRQAPLTPMLMALCDIAAAATRLDRAATTTAIDHARSLGASDMVIHDTVLIASSFCMFNRYVDGMETDIPTDPEVYARIGRQRSVEGYATPPILTP